jgi:hypothetical protein
MTLGINDIQHNGECRYAECRYVECHDYLNVMLSVVILNVIMLSVVMPNVVMLSVLATCKPIFKIFKKIVHALKKFFLVEHKWHFEKC